jgi:hypothetical protein
MYIPEKSIKLKEIKVPKYVVGLQGAPGTGKSTSALTFPNPMVLAAENGLTVFAGVSDAIAIPFYDNDWVCSYAGGIFKPKQQGALPNRRDAIAHWLQNEGMKLEADQTCVVDSWTELQSCFDAQQVLEPKITKQGGLDEYDFWEKKIDYSEKIMSLLHSLKCHVVVCFHEHAVRDPNSGVLLDKIAPLMQGKFVAKLKKYFPDYFRCVVEQEKDSTGRVVKPLTYYWQAKSDNKFDAKTTLDIPADTFYIEPNFKAFEKYKKVLK